MSRVQVFEDHLDIVCETATIEPLDPNVPSSLDCYPVPRLRPSGTSSAQSLPVVILENTYLHAIFAPTLGGRLLQCIDRRTQLAALSDSKELGLSASWPRGAGLDSGVHIIPGLAYHSLAPVDWVVREWQDGSSSWIAHLLDRAGGVSYHATWTLEPNSAHITLDFRAINRKDVDFYKGLGIGFGNAVRWCGMGRSLALQFENGALWHMESRVGGDFLPTAGYGSGITTWYVQPGTPIAPRQTISFKVRLTPYTDVPEPMGVSSAAALGTKGNQLVVRGSLPCPGSRIFVLTATDRTLETTADLYPEHAQELDLSSFEVPLRHVMIRSADGTVLIDAACQPLLWQTPPNIPKASEQELSQLDWREQTKVTSRRAIGWYAGAIEAWAEGNFGEAIERLDEALLYAGDDHISWWLRAVLERRRGDDESNSLTNAHYLAPLEPLLRAESFLRQPPGNPEPSPIVQPVASNSDALVEVSVRLIEAGLTDDAYRWLDEALRHRDVAMLHYLAAWLLGSTAEKLTEAAFHVQCAEKSPHDLPLPGSKVERDCIRWLHQHFPNQPRLRAFDHLMTKAQAAADHQA